ncbi:N-acyl homoserine lactonase family protein [Tianweitania sediminis]|uniref:N-acyl homoserine lactonase family protein n=1 Tax=Tianweitania sediminis TaxID=1502156 RepID=A0A8J7R3T4_9HYPH|nr:N-acyl homoserine lactonase family protein [Tianweitania sediminis]MBP0440071.1 N-acyl homoserine lactonase family protein [Tianweitania sediminis]
MFRLYALKYAELTGRKRSDVFLTADPHDGHIDMAYYIWVAVRDDGEAVVIDTGFTPETAAKRGRVFLEHPTQLFARIDVDPTKVRNVIVTHLHYDHAGNFSLFPNARFHIQDDEMAFATGRDMGHPALRAPFEVEDVVEMVRAVYGERVIFHNGDASPMPGIELFKVGGHSRGLQFVRVATARGPVVVASDAAHYYESFEEDRLFGIVDSLGAMVTGFRRLREIGGEASRIVPGHDPEVLLRYPAPREKDDGFVAALHLPPSR